MTDPLPLHAADLQPGDVLMHMGCGDLSKLIAWTGDGDYSHAALVIEGGQLIESAASGVRHAGLVERTRMLANFHYIDVFRPLRPEAADADGVAQVLAATDVYLGLPYPMTSLLMLGLVCAVRNKLPGDEGMREILRLALDQVVKNDPSQVVCSELVYRGFDEAATTPAHALRLKVITRPVQNTPFPDVDMEALIRQTLADSRQSNPQQLAMDVSARTPISEPALADLLQQARAKLALDEVLTSSTGDYVANPKTVLPADLEFSPSLRKVGRLVMAE